MRSTRARRSPTSLARSDGPGGAVIRRLLPATVGLLTSIGVLRWRGEDRGLYGSKTGVGVMTASAIAVNGGLLWYFGHWLDREEAVRLNAERKLRASARHFELTRDLHCTAGFDGCFRQLNAAWTRTLGWSEEELCSRPFAEFVHPDDRAQTELESAGLAQGGTTVNFVNRYATKAGGWRWIDWRAIGVPEDGMIYASARDVTDDKEAEAALAASERQTRKIIQTAHDAFISIDEEGLINDWNPQAHATFGWARDEALGRPLADLIIPHGSREAHRRGIERFLATGEGEILNRRLELTGLRRDGSVFPLEVTISPLLTPGGYVFNAFLRDITEARRAQEEVALARDQAIEASRMKSMFVANVSHEIRTPMNGVIGISELLLATELDSEQRELAQTISSSGEALLVVVDDILDFSKIEAGKLKLDPTDFALRDMVERACGMFAARAYDKGLEFVVAIDPEVPEVVHGDAARLGQVIANFVSNAIKFTASGELVVHVTSRRDGDTADLVRVSVTDSGIGIEPAALGQLFRSFSQADGSTTRKYGGTGLGLAISRQLIELMGGEVGAESRPGEGSCFWFELSLARAEGDAACNREEGGMAGLRVLVVDAESTGRRALERQLRSWQMSVQVTDDPSDAIAMLESAAAAGASFTLALVDVATADAADRYELVRAIRERPVLNGLRLIVLASAGVRSEMPPLEADAVLTKPVGPSRLYDRIQAVIAGDGCAGGLARSPEPVTDAVERPPVLVVEDTLVNQVVAAKMLARAGYRADIAENGLEALHALTQKAYGAVLMDCQMPALDGYETSAEIRRREQDGPRIPIIAMTANSMQGERKRCLDAGMDDYLAKPLRNELLQAALARWVVDTPPCSMVSPFVSAPRDGDRAAELLDEAILGELEGLDGAILASLTSLYFDEFSVQMTALDRAISSGEMLTIAQIAHKLSGSSSMVGASRAAQVLAELEASARDGDLSRAESLLSAVRSTQADTRSAFTSRLDQRSGG